MSDDRHKLQDKLFLHEFALIGSALASVHLTPDFFGMMEALGMAKDVSKFIHFKPGLSYGHADFRLEAYGILSNVPAEIEEISDDELKAHQHCSGLYVRIPIEEGQIVMGEVWGQRVFKKGIQAYIEEVWIPQNQKWLRGIMRTGDPNSNESIKEIQELSKGYSLLTHLHKQDKRGGDRRPKWKKDLWSIDNLKQYALLVKKVAIDWEWIKSTYEPYRPDSSTWLDELFTMQIFKAMVKAYPKLTRDLILRIVDDTLSSRDREPIGLACVHVFHEMGLTERYSENGESLPPVKTLREYYEKGLKLAP